MAGPSQVFGRVRVSQEQDPSEIDQRFPIDVERCYSGATAWGDADNQCEIVTPHEMVAPRLTAGVKQGDVLAGLRVDTVGFPPLVSIAS